MVRRGWSEQRRTPETLTGVGRFEMNISLRTRIMILFSLITILFTGLLSRFSYVALKEIYMRQASEHMIFKTRLMADPVDARYLGFLYSDRRSSEAGSYYRSFLQQQKTLLGLTQAFLFNDEWVILAVADSAGNEIMTGDAPDPLLAMHGHEISESMRGKPVSSMIFKDTDGNWCLWGFIRLDERHFLGAQEDAEQLAAIDNLSWIFWGILFAGMALTLSGSWWIARVISRPIDALVTFSRELGKGNLKSELPGKLPEELTVLSNAMDLMRENLMRQSRDKEQLLAHIAHEIRNPLGGIELLSGLIREDYLIDGKTTVYSDTILSEINRLKSLVTAYLSYGKPVAASPRNTDLEPILTDIHSLFHPSMRSNGIKFGWTLKLTRVYFDSEHLRQIFINLVSNSARVLEKTGGEIQITSGSENGAAVITVTDNGTGIPEEILSKVFYPFISGSGNGFGLGLAICKKLCDENRASITVHNLPEKGCAFTIRMPLRQTGNES